MSLTTVRDHIVKHHKYAWVFTIASLLVIGGVYFKKEFSQAATFNFTQTSWSGGASATTAVHPGNQSSWNQYSSASVVTAGSTITLPPSSYTATDDGTFSTTGSATGEGMVPAYTKLLLHADGTDGSTTFTDETGKTVTAYGNAQIDTAQSVFGGSSGLFDGTGDYLTALDSADFDFGAGDFTIDLQVRPVSTAQFATMSRGGISGGYIGFILSTTNFIASTNGSSWDISITFSSALTANNWNHLAIVRNGNVYTAYKNGISIGTTTVSGSIVAGTGNLLTIGTRSGQTDFNGWMDEVRISKGIARWTGNFTPPTSAYGSATSYTNTTVSGSGAGASVGLATSSPSVYYSSGTFESATIDLGGKASLGNLDFASTATPSSIGTWTQTADADFTGTNSSTAVSGGSVGLAPPGSIVGTYPTGTGPAGIAFDNVTNSIWVANYTSGTLSKVNITTGSKTDYATGFSPNFITFDNVTNSIWVTDGIATLKKISTGGGGTTSGAVVGTYTPGLSSPVNITFDSETNSVWIPNYDTSILKKISITDGTVVASYTGFPDRHYTSYGNFFDPTTHSVWVASRSNYVSKVLTGGGGTTSGTVTNYAANNGGAGVIGVYGVAIDSYTNSVWTSNVTNNKIGKVRISDGVLVGTYTVGATTNGSMVFDNVTNSVWVSSENSVRRLNASTGALVSTTALAGAGGNAFDNVTNSIWVVSSSANTVSKLALVYPSSGTYTSSIKPVGPGAGFGTMSWSSTLNGQSLTMKVRSCNDSACSGETSFASLPNVTNGQDISSLTGVSDSDGYVQYQATLTTTDTMVTPTLDSVSINITPLALQVATSDSSSGPWTYYGPDGGTYFTSTGTAIPSALSGKQYFRYKAYLATADIAYTPTLDSVTLNYTQYGTSGTLTSSKYDAGTNSNVISNVLWNATGTNADRTVKLQVRSATTAEGLDSAPWCGQSSCSGSTYFTTSNTSNATLIATTGDHQWFQYKIFLDGDGAGTPTVSSVTVQYVVNAPPLIANVTTTQVSDSSNPNYGKVTIAYDVSDSDTSTGATVNIVTPTKYEYSTNGGNTWTEITSGLSANAFTNITLSGNSATSTSPTIVWDPTGINVATTTAQIRVTVSDNEAANKFASASSANFTLDSIVPAVATNINSSTAGATGGTITFTATDFSTMQYRLCNDNLFPTTDTQGNSCAWSSASATYASTTVTSHVLTGYPSNETVYMGVRDLYGNTTAKTLTAPATPGSFDFKDVSNTNIDVYREFLSWGLFTDTANSTFSSYKVYEAHTADGSTPASGAYTVLTTITNRATNFYTHDITAATSSTYFYKVVAVDTDGDTGNETEVFSDIPNGTGGATEVPPVITDTPAADVIKNTSARIAFTTDILATSIVEYGTTPSYGQSAPETSYTKSHQVYLNNLTPNTTYYLRVKATSAADLASEWKTGTSFSTVSGPVITGVTTMDITDKNATIFWNTSASSTSKVYYGTGRSGSALTGQVTVSGADAVTAGTNGLYQHQVGIPTTGTLTAGVTYYYKVESTSRDGQNITTTDDNNGQFYSFATTYDTTAPVISDIDAAVISSASAVIVWTTDEPATSQVKWSGTSGNHSKRTETEMAYAGVPAYAVYHVATLSAQTDNIGEGGGKNTLSPEIPYYYTVVSADAAGNSTESLEKTFTTTKTGETVVVTRRITEVPEAGAVPDTTPPIISNVTVSDITPFSATVTFDTDEGAVGKLAYGKDASYGDNASDDFSWATAHTIKLRGLTLGTEYHIKVTAVDKSGNIGTGNDLTFKTTFLSENLKDLAKIENIEQFQKEIEETIESILPSLVPPFVSKPAVADITENSAAISFRTNIRTFPLVGFVEDTVYDATKDNPYTSEVSDTTEKATSHTLALLNLKPNTKYHIQARAFSLPQVVGKSDDLTFTTKASKIIGSIVERKRDSFTVVWITDEPTSSIVEYKNLKSGITERKTDAAMTSSHSMKIENLPSATTYEVNISGINATGNLVEGGSPLSVTTSKDVTAPVLSNFKVSNAMVPGRTDRIQTIISWTTDEPADAVVYYEEGIGTPTAEPGRPGEEKELANKSALTDSLTLSHAIIISALKPGTIYRIKVSSTDESGNTGVFGPRTIITPKQTESITDIIFKNFEDSFKFLRDL